MPEEEEEEEEEEADEILVYQEELCYRELKTGSLSLSPCNKSSL